MSDDNSSPLKLIPFMQEQEKMYLELLLKQNDWKMAKSAAVAGISRKSLWEKLKKHGISKPTLAPV